MKNNTLLTAVTPEDKRFIADVMLGKLARWLRLLGFDTLYDSDISDSKLLKVAREEGRFILTRDTRFLKIRGIRDCLLIKSNNSFKQLLEVLRSLNLGHFKPLSRCVECNGLLLRISDKGELKDTVPEFVSLNVHVFLKCSECDKIYWEGTHPKMFKEKLSEILRNNLSSNRDISS